MKDVPAHLWPQVRIVVELTRCLTRAGLVAPSAGLDEDVQLMEWAAEFGRTGGVTATLAESRLAAGMNARGGDQAGRRPAPPQDSLALEAFALRKAHNGGWVARDQQGAPGESSIDRGARMLNESRRLDAVATSVNGEAPQKSHERRCLEKQVLNDLRVQLLTAVLQTEDLRAAGATVELKAAGRFASVAYKGVHVAMLVLDDGAALTDRTLLTENAIRMLEAMVSEGARATVHALNSARARRDGASAGAASVDIRLDRPDGPRDFIGYGDSMHDCQPAVRMRDMRGC